VALTRPDDVTSDEFVRQVEQCVVDLADQAAAAGDRVHVVDAGGPDGRVPQPQDEQRTVAAAIQRAKYVHRVLIGLHDNRSGQRCRPEHSNSR
jgi:hypothetical protein